MMATHAALALLTAFGVGAEPAAGTHDAVQSVCSLAASRSPSAIADVWRNVSRAMNENSVIDALCMLDSVRTSDSVFPDSFETDFAVFTAAALLPARQQPYADSGMSVERVLTFDVGHWGRPASTIWRAVSADSARSAPGILFGAEYSVPRIFPLRFHLVEPNRQKLSVNVSEQTSSQILQPLCFDPSRPPARVQVTVAVDVGAERALPVTEYLNRVVDADFDEVRSRSDVPALGSFGVRCVRRSPFRNHPDEMQSYVVFDLPIRRRAGRSDGPAPPGVSEEGPAFARYVVAVRATSDVADRAEALLQRVLQRFVVL